MAKYQSFETERLILKPMSKEDAPFLLELLNTPKWIKYIGDRDVHTVKEATEYIKVKITPQLKKLGYSNYTVIRKSDKEKIGSCGLYDRDGIDGVDIGFAFLPQFEKNGYAYESANKMKSLAFDHFELPIISAITTKENTDSQKLIGKIGLEFVKIIKIPNDDVDLMLYQLKNSKIAN